MNTKFAWFAALAMLVACGLWFALEAPRPSSAARPGPVDPPSAAPAASEPARESGQEQEQREVLGPATAVPVEGTGGVSASPSPQTFWGRLIDRETGHTLPRRWVSPHVGRAVDPRAAKAGALQADPQGFFEAVFEGPGPHLMRCEPEGYGRIVFELTEGYATRERALELTLSRSASWSVLVLDAEEYPMRSVLLQLSGPTFSMARPEGHLVSGVPVGVEFEATTDFTGRADFFGLPPEVPLEVRATHNGEPLPPVDAVVFQPGEERDDVLRPFGTNTVRVVVYAGREGRVPNQELWLLRDERGGVSDRARMVLGEDQAGDVVERATTDENGSAAFEGVQPGHWWVGIAPEPLDPSIAARLVDDPSIRDWDIDGARIPIANPFEVVRGEPGPIVTLHSAKGRFITGHVMGVGSSSTRDSLRVTARARGKHKRADLQAELDDQDRFVFGPLLDGHYELAASSRVAGLTSRPVRTAAGKRRVKIELQADGGLQGRIVDDDSGRLSAGGVVICSSPPSLHLSQSPVNAGRSEFDRSGLPPSTYDVTARTPDGRIGILRGVQLQSGATQDDLEVRVRRGGRLRMRYFGASVQADYRVFDGGSVVAAGSLHRGTTDLIVAPAGELRVELDAFGAGVHKRSISVPLGAEVEVVFDLRE